MPSELAPQSECPLLYSRAESAVAGIRAQEEDGDGSTPADEARGIVTAGEPAQASLRLGGPAVTKAPGAQNDGGRKREASWGLWAYVSGADRTDSRKPGVRLVQADSVVDNRS